MSLQPCVSPCCNSCQGKTHLTVSLAPNVANSKFACVPRNDFPIQNLDKTVTKKRSFNRRPKQIMYVYENINNESSDCIGFLIYLYVEVDKVIV